MKMAWSFYLQYIMNTRVLKQSNNAKKTLQIVRNNRHERTAGAPPINDLMYKNHSSYLSSSKAVAANKLSSQEENTLPPEQKKVSFSESKTSFGCQHDNWLGKEVGPWRGRSSSSLLKTSEKKGGTLDEAISRYIETLRGRGLLRVHQGYYTLQTSKFSKVLSYIICAYNSSQNILQFQQKLLKPDHKFAEFMRRSDTPANNIPSEKLRFKKLLSLSSKVSECTILSDNHAPMEVNYQKMEEQVQHLREEVVTLRERRDRLQGQVAKRHNQFTIINFQIQKLQYDFDQYIKREEYLKEAINAREAVFAQLDNRRYSILRVLEEPIMASFRQCFEETQRLQESLFLFAEYLQCNPLGNRSYQQSKRTICNERLLDRQLREMKRMLGGQSGMKEDILGAFLGKYHQEYRQMIDELQAVIAEKTDLITKFTTSIAQWRQKHAKRHNLLAVLKEAFLLEEIQSEAANLKGQQCKQATENLIKLFKVCHPLF